MSTLTGRFALAVAGAQAHDAQVDGVEGQLGENAGQNGGDAAEGVEKARDQTRQHTGHDCAQQWPARWAAPLMVHNDADRAAGTQRAVHRQICNIQNAIGDVNANGHHTPDQALCNGAGHGVQQRLTRKSID